MPELRYVPNTNPWPMDAEYSGISLRFSGTFVHDRVNARKAKIFLRKFVNVVLVLFAVLAALIFIAQGYKALPSGNILFFLEKSSANLWLFVGIYSAMYLYARIQQRNLDKHQLSFVRIDSHKQNSEPLDVYHMFSEDVAKYWDEAGLEAQKTGYSPDIVLLQKFCQSDEAKAIFFRLGINQDHFKSSLGALPKDNRSALEIPYIAFEEALKLRAPIISAPILIYATIKHAVEVDTGAFSRVLREYGIDSEKIETIAAWQTNAKAIEEELHVLHTFAHRKSLDTNKGLTAVPTPYLNNFSTDLTNSAKHGGLPMTLARNADLENILNLFSNNTRCVTIKGEEGTGKTAILNALAYRMVAEDVPRALEDKRLVKLETASVIGSDVPPEAVLENAITEAEHSGNIVLVIEDIHLLAQAKGAHGLTMLQVLITRLAASKILAIATTTPGEFLEFSRNTTNFEQVFTLYEVLPLSEQGLMQAACLKASFLESTYKVFFTYEAVQTAIRLSGEFFKNQGQPQAVVTLLTAVAERYKGSSSRKVITAEDVQVVTSEKSHVPKESLSNDDSQKLLALEDQIAQHVIGQKAAVNAVAEAIRRSRSGLSGKNRPIGSFLFVGPTGVGKTELAKTLAQVYFGSEEYFLRLDMSEYQGADGIRKLLGNQNSDQTAFVKHLEDYPFCLFLLDEFEKASHEVLNLFLQVLEDGRLTTDSGQTLDLTKTIIIATSNAGTTEIQAGLKNGQSLEQIKAGLFENILSKHYAPELLNRFDDVILFAPLTPEEVKEVAKLFLNGLAKQIKQSKDLDFSFDDASAELIASKAYDPLLGARPIRRYIQDHVENLVAKQILQSNPRKGSRLKLEVLGGELVVNLS